jgi:hypothetical protein
MQCLTCGHQYPGQLPRPRSRCGGDGLVTAAADDLTVHGCVTAGYGPAQDRTGEQ